MKYVKNSRRERLSDRLLNDALLIRTEGVSVKSFDDEDCGERFQIISLSLTVLVIISVYFFLG